MRVTTFREHKPTFTYSLKRLHCEVGVGLFLDAAMRLLTPRSGADEEDGVLEEARVCMQDNTTLETATSLVNPQRRRLKEFSDS